MSGPFRVAIDDQRCGQCDHGRTHHVIGPDEVASSVSYEDEEDAEYLRDECNRAYELGRAAGITEGIAQTAQDLWTPFAEGSMPPSSGALIVWDAEFRSMSSFYYIDGSDTLKKIRELHYSHYMLASALAGPRNPSPQPPPVLAPAADPAPETQPTDDEITDEALRTVHGKTYDDGIKPAGDAIWDDDIPF